MDAVNCVLDRHGRDQDHAGQDGLPAIAVWIGLHLIASAAPPISSKQNLEDDPNAVRQHGTEQSRDDHHGAKHRKRQQLRKRAGGAERKRSAEVTKLPVT
jgi:hypothetical protein